MVLHQEPWGGGKPRPRRPSAAQKVRAERGEPPPPSLPYRALGSTGGRCTVLRKDLQPPQKRAEGPPAFVCQPRDLSAEHARPPRCPSACRFPLCPCPLFTAARGSVLALRPLPASLCYKVSWYKVRTELFPLC